MKVLVTGGAGFIGSNFIRHVLRKRPDWRIVNLDKLTYAGNPENVLEFRKSKCHRFVQGDIADRRLLGQLFRRESFDAVVNFAAESHVDRSILDPSRFTRTNATGTQALLEAARKYPPSRFVQISTDEVYGSVPSGKCPETAPLRPGSPYAASKASADLICGAYVKTYGSPVILTRSSNNYGPRQFPEKLIPLAIHRLLRGETVPLYGTGENRRDWLYVEDNCRAILQVVERGRAGSTYNIGSGEECSNVEVVRSICDSLAARLGKSARELERRITFVADRPGHDLRYAMDCRKIGRELGWSPATSFKNGLRKTIQWYVQNQGWVRRVTSGEYRKYYTRVYERNWR